MLFTVLSLKSFTVLEPVRISRVDGVRSMEVELYLGTKEECRELHDLVSKITDDHSGVRATVENSATASCI